MIRTYCCQTRSLGGAFANVFVDGDRFERQMLRSFGIRSEPSSRRKPVFIKCPIRFCTYDAACASLGAVLDSLGEHLAATAAFFRARRT